jgi:alanyl-tRNA synthetase
VQTLTAGDRGIAVLSETPFYAESGGQVGDRGELTKGGVCLTLFAVEDTQKIQAEVFGHFGTVVNGELNVGDTVAANVDHAARARTMRNHSATHLMHKALRDVLGSARPAEGLARRPRQDALRLRAQRPVTDDEIRRIEAIVNAEILRNAPTEARTMAIDAAQKSGAMMLFGEKYGDEVRVLDIGGSRELCGGTHVARTGDIGFFKIVAESGVAAGIRRVEAVTGDGALAWVQAREAMMAAAASALKVPAEEMEPRVAQLIESAKAAEKEIAKLRGAARARQAGRGDRRGDAHRQGREGARSGAGRRRRDRHAGDLDKVKDRMQSGIAVLATVNDGKVSLIAGVTKDLTGRIKAGELVNHVAQQVGGKGGGRPDMAQAGGTNAAALPDALRSIEPWLEQRL